MRERCMFRGFCRPLGLLLLFEDVGVDDVGVDDVDDDCRVVSQQQHMLSTGIYKAPFSASQRFVCVPRVKQE